MEEKEKYLAEIETRLVRFGDTMHEIKEEMQRRKENLPDIQLDATARKHEEAKGKFKEIKKTDEGGWQKLKEELDNLVYEIDEDLRKSLAYFG
jgi:hypothetical protein